MKKYLDFIEETRLISEIESCTTTGDLDYPGTALEIRDKDDNELFHIVTDSTSERQIIFFAQDKNFRIPLNLMEKIIKKAKEIVICTN